MGFFDWVCDTGRSIWQAGKDIVSTVYEGAKSIGRSVYEKVSYVAKGTYDVLTNPKETLFGKPFEDEYKRLSRELDDQRESQRKEIKTTENEYKNRLDRLDSSISDAERELRNLENRNKKAIGDLESSIEEQKLKNNEKMKKLKEEHEVKTRTMGTINLEERKKLDKTLREEIDELHKQNDRVINGMLNDMERERKKQLAEMKDANRRRDKMVRIRLNAIEEHSDDMAALRSKYSEAEKNELENLHNLKVQHLQAQREHIKEVTDFQMGELRKQGDYLEMSYQQKWGNWLTGHFEKMIESVVTSHATLNELTSQLENIEEEEYSDESGETSLAMETSKELLKIYDENARHVDQLSLFLRSQVNQFSSVDPELKSVLRDAALRYKGNQNAITQSTNPLQRALENQDFEKIEEIRLELEDHKRQLQTTIIGMQLVRHFDKNTLTQILGNPELYAVGE